MGGKAAAERWRIAHPFKARAIRRKAAKVWRAAHPETARAADRAKHLLKKYGLTTTEWDRLFAKQGARCAACGQTGSRWAIDHNHTTGEIRGILCLHCNTDLGLLENTTCVSFLRAYLERPPCSA